MRQFLLIVFLFVFVHSAHAGWKQVAQMDEAICCGYFFDADHGLIGSGLTNGFISAGTKPILKIWRTNDGGVSWILCKTPDGTGSITRISMRDTLVGFASIHTSTYSLWRTHDGGATWVDITGTEVGRGTSVYATPTGLIKTMWAGATWDGGGYSGDDGNTFDHLFKPLGFTSLNCIDFADDNYGVISPGPSNTVSRTLYTSNGGITWGVGGLHPESWGMYAVKGTHIFITLGEGKANSQNSTVRISKDDGRSWDVRYIFTGNQTFTGHIAGRCSSLYVQTQYFGLYRSDDLGLTWKSVNGPSNVRDSRFVVTGNNGEVVYAFDNDGGVFKTSDGGDNTLTSSVGTPDFSFFPDTVFFSMKDCLADRKYLTITTPLCSGFMIDSLVVVSGDTVFRVDTLTTLGAPQPGSVRIPILFRYDTTGEHLGKLHIRGRAGSKTVDTLIPLVGKNTSEFIFHIFPDTLSIATKDCKPERSYVTLTTPVCLNFIVDSLSIVSGGLTFSVDTTGNIFGAPSSSVSIPVRFQYDSNGSRSGMMHVRAHAGSIIIDTLIRLYGANTSDFKLFCFPDTAFIFTSYCQPKQTNITFSTPICSEMHIDTMYVVSGENEFWIEPKDIFSGISPQSSSLPIHFVYNSEAVRTGMLRIRASRGSSVIDTVIPLVGKNVTAPVPYIGMIATAVAGDTVHIPIHLKATQDTFTIKKFIVHISYNTDLLSYSNFEVKGTLANPIKNPSYTNDAGGTTFTCELLNAVTEKSDLTMPIIRLVMNTYLSNALTTTVSIDKFSVESLPSLALCSIPEQLFAVKYLCGDSILTRFMKDSSMPQFLSLIPNPAGKGDQVAVKIYLPVESVAAIDVIDGEGNVVSKGEEKKYPRGEHTQMIETRSLSSGAYFIKLRLSNGYAITNRLVIVK